MHIRTRRLLFLFFFCAAHDKLRQHVTVTMKRPRVAVQLASSTKAECRWRLARCPSLRELQSSLESMSCPALELQSLDGTVELAAEGGAGVSTVAEYRAASKTIVHCGTGALTIDIRESPVAAQVLCLRVLLEFRLISAADWPECIKTRAYVFHGESTLHRITGERVPGHASHHHQVRVRDEYIEYVNDASGSIRALECSVSCCVPLYLHPHDFSQPTFLSVRIVASELRNATSSMDRGVRPHVTLFEATSMDPIKLSPISQQSSIVGMLFGRIAPRLCYCSASCNSQAPLFGPCSVDRDNGSSQASLVGMVINDVLREAADAGATVDELHRLTEPLRSRLERIAGIDVHCRHL